MRPLKQLILMALLVSLSFAGLAAQLTPEQQQAKKQGTVLWNQNKRSEAAEQLLISAKAGDEESQYLLADSLSRSLAQFPKEYQNNAYWYEAAANQGNVYAMYRLNQLCQNYSQLKQCHNSTDHWSKVAMDTLTPKITANNPEALYQYYIFTRDIDYLKKSAEANFPEAQYRYAEYFVNNERNKDKGVEWYKKAANNGYIKALDSLSSYYIYTANNPSEAKKYLLETVSKSYIDAIEIYARELNGDVYGYKLPKDLVKSYAFYLLLAEVNNNTIFFVKESDLTPEQVKEAKAFAEQWQKEHPPLSYYQSPVFNGSLDR